MGMFDEIRCETALPDDACEAGPASRPSRSLTRACAAIGLRHWGDCSIWMAMISSRAGTLRSMRTPRSCARR